MSIPFLNGLTISLDKLPTYPEYEGDFIQKLDLPIMNLIFESNNDKLNPEMKADFKRLINNTCSNGVLITKHHQTYKNLGRFYPDDDNSIIVIARIIKHTIFHYLGWIDIDMIKAHATLGYLIAKQNGIKLKGFKKYLIDFDNFCDEIRHFYNEELDKDDIKYCFNIMLYGGGFQKWVDKIEKGDLKKGYKPKKMKTTDIHPVIQQYKNDCVYLQTLICHFNPDLKNILRKKDDEEHETNNRLTSYWFQTIENHIVYDVYLFLCERGIIKKGFCAPEYDGLCIPPACDFDKDDIIKQINELVLKNTGLGVKFKFKGYENVLTDIIEQRKLLPPPVDVSEVVVSRGIEDIDLTPYINKMPTPAPATAPAKIPEKHLYNYTFTSGLISDFFKQEFGTKFIYSNEQLYYFNGVYWAKDDKKNSYIHKFVDNQFYSHLVKYTNTHLKIHNDLFDKATEEEKEKHTANIDKINKFLSNIQFIRQKRTRNELIEDIITKITDNDIEFDTKSHLFAFTNKIYDLNKNIWVEPNPADYISMTTKYPYNDEKKDDKKVVDGLLNDILGTGDKKDFYLTILATGLYGEQLINFIIANGGGGNGKSALHEFMLAMLGDYGYRLPSSCLLDDIKTGGNPELSNMKNKRFVVAVEPAQNKSLNTSTVKELTGNKILPVRNIYSDKVGVNNCSTIVFEANSIPKLDNVDEAIERRMRVIPFKTRFVSAEVFEKLGQTDNFKIADSSFTTQEFKDNNKQFLFDILIEYFKKFKEGKYSLPKQPEECAKITRDYMAASDGIFDWFCDVYERDEKDTEEPTMLSFKDIYKQFTVGDYYINMTKQDKRTYNLKYFTDKVEKNLFLREFIKRRKEYVGKFQLSSDKVVGWSLKLGGRDDDEDDSFNVANIEIK